MKLKVEYISPSVLTEAEGNAKIHTKEQVDQIKRSIEKFGFNDPIGVWGKSNTVVEGNGRLQAAKQLGLSEIPIIRLDTLTPEQRDAYAAVHNKLTMNTGFDFAELSKKLGSLQESFDMADFGFSGFEISFEHDLKTQLERKQARDQVDADDPKKVAPRESFQTQELETPEQAKEAEKRFENEWATNGANPEKTSVVCEIACDSEEEIEWLKSVLHQKKLNQIYRCRDLMREY